MASTAHYLCNGRPQRDHFEQLFMLPGSGLTKKKSFAQPSHVWFGTILGEDNKAIKTRDGQPVKLMDLLNEAIEQAKKMVRKKTPTSTNKRRREGLEWLDLEQCDVLIYLRTEHWIMFSLGISYLLSRVTSSYLQYAVARIHSIFRKVDGSLRLDYSGNPTTVWTGKKIGP